MILFFDTETTGFYKDRLPFDHVDQPHLVQIALMLTKDDGEPVSQASLIVNPGVPIPLQASSIHGIGDDLAAQVGVSERTALGLYGFMASRADLIVAHNAKFDINVMACLYARAGESPAPVSLYCTMEASTALVNLPPTERMIAAGMSDKPKPPKLSECIAHFFGEDLEGAHDALVDVTACARVYFHLQSLEKAA